MTDRFRVVPASYVFLLRRGSDGDEVLLQLRQNTGYMDGYWAAAAAGHVERGETAYDAARREAREEIDVDDLELEFLTSMQRTGVRRPDRRAHRLLLRGSVVVRGTADRGAGEVCRSRVVRAHGTARPGGTSRAPCPHPSGGGGRAVHDVRFQEGLTTRPAAFRDVAAPTAHRKETRMVIELGEQPTPEVEPAEPPPGGVDAIDEEDPTPVVPDLSLLGTPPSRTVSPTSCASPRTPTRVRAPTAPANPRRRHPRDRRARARRGRGLDRLDQRAGARPARAGARPARTGSRQARPARAASPRTPSSRTPTPTRVVPPEPRAGWASAASA